MNQERNIGNNIPEIHNIEKENGLREMMVRKVETRSSIENIPGHLELFDIVLSPLMLIDLTTENFTIVNKAFSETIGYTKEELIGQNAVEMGIVSKEDLIEPRDIIMRNGTYQGIELPMKTKSGEVLTARISGQIINLEGKPFLLQSIADFTEVKKTRESLKESENRFETIFYKSPDAISLHKIGTGECVLMNNSFTKITGFTEEDAINNPNLGIDIWVDLEERTQMVKMLKEKGSIENFAARFRVKNGEIRYGSMSANIISYEGTHYIMTITKDITEQRVANERNLYLSTHDELTGLFNRRYLENELTKLDLNRELPISVLMVDLDGVKLMNDAFGHVEGDRLLVSTAKILSKIAESKGIVARWGGDEFMMVLPYISKEELEKTMEEIKEECRSTLYSKIPIHLSIGAATKEKNTQNMVSIMQLADRNMYNQKLLQKESSASSVIMAIEEMLHQKSEETSEHTIRVKNYALKLGQSLNLRTDELNDLVLLASLHDIGKVSIPETILKKTEKLTEEEWKIMKTHTDTGYKIAKALSPLAHLSKYIQACH